MFPCNTLSSETFNADLPLDFLFIICLNTVPLQQKQIYKQALHRTQSLNFHPVPSDQGLASVPRSPLKHDNILAHDARVKKFGSQAAVQLVDVVWV